MNINLARRERLLAKADNVRLTEKGNLLDLGFRMERAIAVVNQRLADQDDVTITVDEWCRIFLGGAYGRNKPKAKEQIRRVIRTFWEIGMLAVPDYIEVGEKAVELGGIKRVARISKDSADEVLASIWKRRELAAKRRDFSRQELETLDALIHELSEPEGDDDD